MGQDLGAITKGGLESSVAKLFRRGREVVLASAPCQRRDRPKKGTPFGRVFIFGSDAVVCHDGYRA